MRLTATRIIAGDQLIKLPRRGGPKGAAAITEAADAIVAGYARRYSADKAAGDKEGRMGEWLLPVCLALIEYCNDIQQTEVLRSRIAAWDRETSRERLVDRLVLGIFAADRTFTAHNISYYSNRIYYALRHYVPSALVNGFINQIPRFDDKKDLDSIEPGFDDWIISQRWLEFDHSMIRGRYPDKINQTIKKLQSAGMTSFLSRYKVKTKHENRKAEKPKDPA